MCLSLLAARRSLGQICWPHANFLLGLANSCRDVLYIYVPPAHPPLPLPAQGSTNRNPLTAADSRHCRATPFTSCTAVRCQGSSPGSAAVRAQVRAELDQATGVGDDGLRRPPDAGCRHDRGAPPALQRRSCAPATGRTNEQGHNKHLHPETATGARGNYHSSSLRTAQTGMLPGAADLEAEGRHAFGRHYRPLGASPLGSCPGAARHACSMARALPSYHHAIKPLRGPELCGCAGGRSFGGLRTSHRFRYGVGHRQDAGLAQVSPPCPPLLYPFCQDPLANELACKNADPTPADTAKSHADLLLRVLPDAGDYFTASRQINRACQIRKAGALIYDLRFGTRSCPALHAVKQQAAAMSTKVCCRA